MPSNIQQENCPNCLTEGKITIMTVDEEHSNDVEIAWRCPRCQCVFLDSELTEIFGIPAY